MLDRHDDLEETNIDELKKVGALEYSACLWPLIFVSSVINMGLIIMIASLVKDILN